MLTLLRRRLRPSLHRACVSQRTGGTMASAAVPDLRDEQRIVHYYRRQGIFVAEELERIRQVLQAPLPACFRVNPSSPHADEIKRKLTSYFPAKFAGIQHENQSLLPPRELSWYPIEHCAWQLDCGRSALIKLSRGNDGLREFREFLMSYTADGHISRQEAVSMIPALLLSIEPHHRVLDMCAAPGSKTAQVMEELGQLQVSKAQFAAKTGFILANDANEKRGYMLVHQLMRLGLDTAVVTCHFGQEFPGLYNADGELQRNSVFDRVICDVPCSGDGTIRKNPNIWKQWTPGAALTLHKTQLDIGMRAAALLKPDGMMVYSTCSLNPIENEAVVAELLRRAGGALELVDCSEMLPGLKFRPGMQSWSVVWQSKQARGNDMDWFGNFDDVPASLKGMRLLKSMFPTDNEDINKLLPRCMRLFPTDQNTGGFFVALLRKKHALPGDDERGLGAYEDTMVRMPTQEGYVCKVCGSTMHSVRNCDQLPWKILKAQQAAEAKAMENEDKDAAAVNLHTYTKLSEEHWLHLKHFYGISDEFPHEHLYGRSDGATSICLVNANVQSACLAGRDLKLLNTGVRVFARITGRGQLVFRPTDEGLSFLLPFITKRTAVAPKEDIERILVGNRQSILMDVFTPKLQEIVAEQRAQYGTGPIVLVLPPPAAAPPTTPPLAVPVWVGGNSLAILVDKDAQKAMREKVTSY